MRTHIPRRAIAIFFLTQGHLQGQELEVSWSSNDDDVDCQLLLIDDVNSFEDIEPCLALQSPIVSQVPITSYDR